MHFFRFALAAALLLTASTLAHAQTVLVRNVPIGETIEVFVNETKSGSGTVAPNGSAEMNIDLRAATGATELDSRVYVDVCSTLRRIYVVNRNIQPPAKAEGCDRREILGVFWIRQRSTLVIDAGSVIPTMLLRQGKYDPTAGVIGVKAPRGIVVFVGGGMSEVADFVRNQCAQVSDCSGDSNVVAVTGGVDLWLTNWLAIEGGYSKPNKVTVEGFGGTYKFTDTFDAHYLTAAGKIGIPIGRARMYAKGGGLFHRATTSSVVTINEEQQTVRLRTEGWGWLAGGGIEVWTGRKFAIFGELQIGKIKGEAVGDNLEGTANDRMTHILGGFRVKVF